jgi:predicted anti-sigma-YlaC factor YlaD
MKDCVLFAPLIGARAGELTLGESKALEAHLSACSSCRGVARNAAAVDGLVGEALLARANVRDFAPFVDGVMTRIERAPRGGLLSWLHRRRRAAVAALVPALAALAVIVYVRLGAGPDEVAMLEVSSEGEATTILETKDGPVVLLAEENET